MIYPVESCEAGPQSGIQPGRGCGATQQMDFLRSHQSFDFQMVVRESTRRIHPMVSIGAKQPTAGIILAAGISRRLGQPKQLLRFQGKFLLENILENALASRLDTVVLVLGHQAQKIVKVLGAKLDRPRLKVIVNRQYREGMSSSLRAGLREVMEFPSVMFLLGDQPWINNQLINLLLDRFRKSEKDICVPVHQDRRGNPVIFSRRFYDTLMKIEGDIGAREVIASNPRDLLEVEVSDPDVFSDIDTVSDLEALNAMPAIRPLPINGSDPEDL